MTLNTYGRAAGGLALAAAISACAPMAPVGAGEPPAPIRPFDLPTIERLGHQMYEQDGHAAAASDLLVARRVNGAQERLSIWITEASDSGERVRWLRRTDTGFEAAYDISFERDRETVFSVPQNRQLTAAEIAQHDARLLALSSIQRRCSDRYNTVALKDPESDAWLVWALAATESDAIVFGGHYRFTISADGHTILRTDALSRGCLTMPSQSSSGQNLVGRFVSHLVSDTPIETHVYLNLLHKLPIVVLTPPGGQSWFVENARITKSDRPPVESRSAP